MLSKATSYMPRRGLALLIASACCAVALDWNPVEDDECSGEGSSGCALHALQHRASGRIDTEQQAEEAEWHASRHRPTHALVVVDHQDYRADAFEVLQRILEVGAPSEDVSLVGQSVEGGEEKDEGGEEDEKEVRNECRLPYMSFEDLERRWNQHLEEFWGQAADSVSEDELSLAKASFHSQLAEGMPIRVGVDVVEKLGWPAQRLWERDELVRRLHDINFTTFAFVYPEWVQTFLDLRNERYPMPDDVPINETLQQYLASGQSGENVLLFASEDKSGDITPGGKVIIDALRNDFSPNPSFAFRSDQNKSILAIDGIGSSHGFHSHGPVWQTQVKGYKMWYLLPPGHAVTDRSSEGSPKFASAPLVDGRPVEVPNACAFLRRREPPPGTHECLFSPGEMLILPPDWLHATCALSNYTAAVGGWLPEKHDF